MSDVFDEQLDNLFNTRDTEIYLDSLLNLRSKYLIILSIKDTPAGNVPDCVVPKLHKLGFTNFFTTPMIMYVGISNQGEIIFNECGKVIRVHVVYEGSIASKKVNVISGNWRRGERSQIIIDDIDYSLDCGALNFVVFDPEIDSVVDSVSIVYGREFAELYHKNLQMSDKYFKNHFFVLEKYKDKWYEPYKKKYFSNRKLGTSVITNGIILPNKVIDGAAYGGVCTDKFDFISGNATFLRDLSSNSRHIAGSYSVEDNEISYIDEVVVYGGTLPNHPGHLLGEGFVDRLWWYTKYPNAKYKLAVVGIWSGDGTFPFQKEYLRQFGFVDEDIIFITKPTKFRKVVVPDQSAYPYKSVSIPPYDYTLESVAVFKQLGKNIPIYNFKKVYFTKSKTQKENIVGEDYFIDFYKIRGFTIIDPEDYSLHEKIGILHNVDEFATMVGTNSHYAVFCKQSVKLTILSRVKDYPVNTQAYLNETAGIVECYCVDIAMNIIHSDLTYGFTLVGVTDCFKQYVKQYFGEDISITPEESIKQNLFEYLKSFSKYYSNQKAFNYIKNKKMLTVLQNMSETFLGKEFDTSKLDLTTNEDNLRNQVKQLTSDLDASKKRIVELENIDVYKASQILEVTNARLEKQVSELRNALDNMQNKQAKIDELTSRNIELEKALLEANHAYETQSKDLKRLQENAESISAQLAVMRNENEILSTKKFELKKQVAEYENSRSWRITKPLRSIAQFFNRLFGKQSNEVQK